MTRTTASPEEAEWEALERTKSVNAGTHNTLIARELDAIKTQYGSISAEDINTHLVGCFSFDTVPLIALGQTVATSGAAGIEMRTVPPASPVEAGAGGPLLALGGSDASGTDTGVQMVDYRSCELTPQA